MRLKPLLITVAILASLGALAHIFKLGQRLAVAASFSSHHLCSETFISGLDPERVFDQRIAAADGIHLVRRFIRYSIDRAHGRVDVSIAGLYPTTAIYRGVSGCLVVHDPADLALAIAAPAATAPHEREENPPNAEQSADALATKIADPDRVQTADPRLAAALEHAFTERAQAPFNNTLAVVVVKDGRIVAERYAPGVGIDTELLGFSATKSLVNALLGILVRQGRLDMHAPAAIAAWQAPDDRRHAITPDQLLRQVSGLDLTQDNSGADVSARLSYLERDEAGFGAQQPLLYTPGTQWAYADGNFVLLSRLIRDTVGGDAASVTAFMQRELFAPLGMHHTTFELDATGTPVGGSYAFASARDWARFGQLYLDDGVAGGQRVLPPGWVAYSSTQTLTTGYGAGFWINFGSGNAPWGFPWGMPDVPKDAFFAMGNNGQHVVIVPSERLVVVRLGVSHHYTGLIDGADRLVSEVIAALKPTP